MRYIFDLPFEEGAELYRAAVEQFQEDLLWDMWLVRYKDMAKENFVSFEQFKIMAKREPELKRSEKEILKDSEDILKSLKKRS